MDNYTKIPNQVMEKLSTVIISGQASMCLHVIMRKTFGFNKESDWISLSQFAEATGMKPSNISPELSKLIKMNIIIRSDKKCYKVNTDVESWGKLSDQIIIQSDNGIIQTDNENYPIGEKKLSDRRDTKERKKILQKKLIQKKVYDDNSDNVRLAAYLYQKIKDQNPYVKPPNIQNWAHDIHLMMTIDNIPALQIEKMIDWAKQDTFWSSNIMSVVKLRKHFPSMFEQMKRNMKEAQSHTIPKY